MLIKVFPLWQMARLQVARATKSSGDWPERARSVIEKYKRPKLVRG